MTCNFFVIYYVTLEKFNTLNPIKDGFSFVRQESGKKEPFGVLGSPNIIELNFIWRQIF